jgi:hypothetical protein
MATATAEPDAIEQDALANIGQLKERRQAFAPEALTDDAIALEVENIESEIRVAEAVLQRTELARGELARRHAEAQAEAENEARAEALERAKPLDAERLKAAASVDASLRKFAAAVADLRRITTAESAELVRAGHRRLDPPSKEALGGALFAVCSDASLDADNVFEIASRPVLARRRPLAESLRRVNFDAMSHPKPTPPRRLTTEEVRGPRRVNVASTPAESWREHRAAGRSPETARRLLEHEYQRPAAGPMADAYMVEQVEKGERQYLESLNETEA